MGNGNDNSKSEKKKMDIIMKVLLAALGYLVLVAIICIGIHGLWEYTRNGIKDVEDIYRHLAISVIIGWVLYLIAYYIWAIHFYNVNQGWTNDDWEKYETKTADIPGLATEEEPDGNPNKGESLGLPPGTVRATLALSLLMAGLAMLIASLSLNNTYPANQLFVDNFEFVKTGFLMMIAFYFGAKSLDILRKTNIGNSLSSTGQGNPPAARQEGEDKATDKNSVG